MHDVALAAEIPVWCGGMLESGIGRSHNLALSSLTGFSLPGDVSASARYWREDIIEPEVKVSARGDDCGERRGGARVCDQGGSDRAADGAPGDDPGLRTAKGGAGVLRGSAWLRKSSACSTDMGGTGWKSQEVSFSSM